MALAINYVVPIAYSAPVALRTRMSALLLLSTGLAGGFGPLIAGAVSDALTAGHGRHAPGQALHLIPICYAGVALCYLLALRSFRDDIVAEDR